MELAHGCILGRLVRPLIHTAIDWEEFNHPGEESRPQIALLCLLDQHPYGKHQ